MSLLQTTRNECRKRGLVPGPGMVHKGCIFGRTLFPTPVTTEKSPQAQFITSN